MASVRVVLGGLLLVVVTFSPLVMPVAVAQPTSPKCLDRVTIRGTVLGIDGKPVSDAVVRLETKLVPDAGQTKSNAFGVFAFASLSNGSYRLSAEKLGSRTRIIDVTTSSENCAEEVDLVFQVSGLKPTSNASSGSMAQAMEFADQPNFTIAGVTDWTAVGGHGSDSTLRTSESLASETANLKPEKTDSRSAFYAASTAERVGVESRLRAAVAKDPNSFAADHQLGEFYLRAERAPEAIVLLESAYKIDPTNGGNLYDLTLAYEAVGNLSQARKCVHELLAHEQSPEFYLLAGELDEKSGDPLSAVHEFEDAARLDPSEQNYFEWGSELLIHRAIWQAQEVFRKGTDTYPKSVRMQTAMGTALFAGARYDEAAVRLCKASDLNPADSNPYIFIGKIEMAAPNSLACVEPMLRRFLQLEPGSAIANYLYAMSILKRQGQSPDKKAEQQAEALLTKAVSIDPKCSEAYLQLGIIAASQRSFEKAIDFYNKAIEANRELADTYYRLGVAYDRVGQPAKAKEEFQLHDQIKQRQAEATEQQRRDLKQFLIVLSGESGAPAIH